MRIVIASPQRLLRATLAACLRERGHDVPAVTPWLAQAPGLVAQFHAELLVADQPDDSEDVDADLAGVAVLVLSAAEDTEAVRRRFRGRQVTVAARSATLSEVVRLVEGTGSSSGQPVHAPVRVSASSATSLAGYLTPREREAISQLVLGADTQLLARRLGVSSRTARQHIQSAFTKLGVHSRLELVSMAVHEGLIEPTSGKWMHPV
ncbi:MAG: two component transcriptional regulator, LuxR family [Frankiales bacterium]|nr:two component transcriptional regulator, LuxR family [Frankiales bacterium]